jgi:hypothetical protein
MVSLCVVSGTCETLPMVSLEKGVEVDLLKVWDIL